MIFTSLISQINENILNLFDLSFVDIDLHKANTINKTMTSFLRI
jgi:hypothetical protein